MSGQAPSRGGSGGTRGLVPGLFGLRPQLGEESARELAREIRGRRPAYTPDWTDPADADAGAALVVLFGEMAGMVASRVNRLPDKALLELVTLAGLGASGPRPAEAFLQFAVAPAAPGSILVPRGFQVSAAATGGGGPVVFETQDDLFVAPAELGAVQVQEGSVLRSIAVDAGKFSRPFPPLGITPAANNALLLGFRGDSAPSSTISIGLQIVGASGIPAPAASGGIEGAATDAGPTLRWEAYTGAGFEPIVISRDETRGLAQSGVVELRLPANWAPGPGPPGQLALRWLRLRLLQGAFQAVPRVAAILPNLVRARAVRTIINEVLVSVPDTEPQRMKVSQTPVIRGSMVLEIIDPINPDARAEEIRWREVPDLAAYGSEARVFLLEPKSGVVTFGDGIHGAVVPPGFRNVRALRYEVGSGKAGAVAAGAISTMLNSAPFLTGVTNPFPASGGTDAASTLEVVRGAPGTIRTKGRAVTVSDYAALALAVEGADVRRAHAIASVHPGFPGRPMPGVVQVLVVPAVTDGGPPLPDEATLAAVARGLTRTVAPAGVEVVASAARFRLVRAEVGFVADPAASTGDVIVRIIQSLDTYLHPLTGGEDGGGWPFGRTLVHADLVRHLLASVPVLRGLPRLRLSVDRVPRAACEDIPLGADELFWPDDHDVYPLEREALS